MDVSSQTNLAHIPALSITRSVRLVVRVVRLSEPLLSLTRGSGKEKTQVGRKEKVG